MSNILDAAAVRRCFIADPGMLMIHADYDQIELRIIGAIAGEPAMIEAAHAGRSLHELTCELMYGPVPLGVETWKDADPHRYKLAKVAGFCAVYGGGAKAISDQADVPMTEARKVATQYKETYSALTDYKNEMTQSVLNQALTKSQQKLYFELRKAFWQAETDEDREAAEKQIKRLCYRKVGWITTTLGRKLYVDAERAYSAVNYRVQSDARDVLAAGGIRLWKSDLRKTLLMFVHDETIGQDFKEKAEDSARRYGEILSTNFMGVPLTAKGEVLGLSWGSVY